MTKEKGQKYKEKLEDTKNVIRSPCLSFYLRLLITSLVSTSLSLSFCPFHFVIVFNDKRKKSKGQREA
jgi:predicted Zn-dependent protease